MHKLTRLSLLALLTLTVFAASLYPAGASSQNPPLECQGCTNYAVPRYDSQSGALVNSSSIVDQPGMMIIQEGIVRVLTTTLQLSGTFVKLTGAVSVGGGTSASAVYHDTCTLSEGSCSVSLSAVTANSRIILTAQDGGISGSLRVTSRAPGSGFTVSSTDAEDEGVVGWLLVEP